MMDLDKHFHALAVAGVQNLKPYEPGKPIADLEREYGLSNIIKLASNENPLGPSPQAIEACQASLKDLQLYPDGNGFALKTALAEKHDVDMSYITLGNGSNDILEFVARVFLSPGYNAVFSKHAFAVYPLVSMAVGAELHIAEPTASDSAMPFGHNLQNMRELVDDNTRVIFIANPNNPTGTWLDSDALEAFIEDVPDNIIIVLDEAYVEYVSESAYPNSIPWIERFPNLIVTRTFSKVYGLAGLRIGYSVSNPELADLLNRVRQPFNTNSIAQIAALVSLDDVEHLQKSVDVNNKGLLQISNAFDEMGIEFIPSVGNFISFKTKLSGDVVYENMLKAGVIIRPIGNYDLPDYLRVTVGSEDQNRRFIGALKEMTSTR